MADLLTRALSFQNRSDLANRAATACVLLPLCVRSSPIAWSRVKPNATTSLTVSSVNESVGKIDAAPLAPDAPTTLEPEAIEESTLKWCTQHPTLKPAYLPPAATSSAPLSVPLLRPSESDQSAHSPAETASPCRSSRCATHSSADRCCTGAA